MHVPMDNSKFDLHLSMFEYTILEQTLEQTEDEMDHSCQLVYILPLDDIKKSSSSVLLLTLVLVASH